jgi:hypothetical protein
MDKKRSLVETFPVMSQVVTEFRRAFGQDQVRILYLKEGDNEVGIKPIEAITKKLVRK